MSLHGAICQRYLNSSSELVVEASISFFSTLAVPLQKSKNDFEYFNSILLQPIFQSRKNTSRLIPLINLYIVNFNAYSTILSYIRSYDSFSYFKEMLLRKKITKQDTVSILRIIRASIFTYSKFFVNDFSLHFMSPKSLRVHNIDRPLCKEFSEKEEISRYIIDSGIFHYYLEELKKNISSNNIVVSAILHCIKDLTLKMDYNPYVKVVREFDFYLEGKYALPNAKMLDKYLTVLKSLNVPSVKEGSNHEYGEFKRRGHQQVLEEEK